MKKIQYLVEQIDEEIEGAKDYAQTFIELKVENDSWSGKYLEMAKDELKHATYIHDYAVQEIEKLKRVYEPPSAMLEEWELSHKRYVERVAWIRNMLSM